jgi:opacity protein-like surface antigen
MMYFRPLRGLFLPIEFGVSFARKGRGTLVVLFVVLGFMASGSAAHGQAKLTASRAGDLQVGGGYSNANSDFVPNRISGFTFYSDFDFRNHFGAEVDFHQLNDRSGDDVYERTYEVGGRYLRNYGSLTPYVKALYGRGVLNYQLNTANLAYNMFVGGGGVDFAVKPYLNVRVDYEYQRWLSGVGIPNGLTPQVLTVGAAYHFGGGKPHTLVQ